MRFEEVKNDVYDLMNKVIDENFDELKDVNFEVVFDTKKKTKGGKIVAAYIKKVNDLISYLAADDFEYMIFLDKKIWNALEEPDRYRLLRHELYHVFIDARDEDVKYNLKDHDFEAFKAEIEIESRDGGDPLWSERIFAVADALYNKEDED